MTILRQQIRDAAGALATARRELAVAMAYHAAEARALDAIGARIDTLSDGARRALGDGREDLGTEAAIHIAALEDERADRRAAADRFAAEIERLKRLVAQGGERLRDLDRGLQTARTTEALRRAGMEGRRVTTLSAGALGRGRADAGAPARRGRPPRRTSPTRWPSWRPRRRPGSRPTSTRPATAAPARTRGRCSTASGPRPDRIAARHPSNHPSDTHAGAHR